MRIVNENGINLQRPKGNEEPKSKYYIIPEGDNTEIQYFCGIRDNLEELNIKSLIEIVPVENEEEERGQSHPKRKLDNFKKSLADGKFTYKKNFDKAIFKICLVHHDYNCIYNTSLSLELFLALVEYVYYLE